MTSVNKHLVAERAAQAVLALSIWPQLCNSMHHKLTLQPQELHHQHNSCNTAVHVGFCWAVTHAVASSG